jgi:hypothetical protein
VLLGPLLAWTARPASAQPRVALRADALVGHEATVHAGLGVETDAGLYARVGVVGGVGVTGFGEHRALGGRAEAVARLVLDPLRQSRRGAYLGGGVGVLAAGDHDTRGYLLAVVGVEGGGGRPGRRGWMPAVELGIGGGARLSLVLRRARPDAR